MFDWEFSFRVAGKVRLKIDFEKAVVAVARLAWTAGSAVLEIVRFFLGW